MPLNLAELLPLFKGRDAKLIEVVFAQWEKIYNLSEARNRESLAKIEALEKKLDDLTKLEENCLQQNVRQSELIRNLVEYIIFDEGRDDKRRELAMLLKDK